MEKGEEAKSQGETNINYYTTPYRMMPDRDTERMNGYMYYPSTSGNGQGSAVGGHGTGVSYYTEMSGMMARDPR